MYTLGFCVSDAFSISGAAAGRLRLDPKSKVGNCCGRTFYRLDVPALAVT